MGISVNGGEYSSFIALPVEVIDKYLSVASGVYIKVLLAIIRHNSIDIKKIAQWISVPKEDVLEAVGYWKSVGVLSNSDSPKAENKHHDTAVTLNDISSERVSEQIDNNHQVKFLLCTAEALYGRPLTSTEQKGLVYINEVIGLSADVIIMAVEYCVSIGKSHFNYIQKLCAAWADDEVNTLERAEKEIKRLTENRGREGQVRIAFGIEERALTATNRNYIANWFNDGFDIDMIKLAYERTVDRIGKLSFPYINKILLSWKEKGIFTESDLNTKEVSLKVDKKSKSTATYDIKKFEELGLKVPK